MLAQNFAQPSLEQMSRGVIAHSRFANCGVDDGVHFLPNSDCLLGNDLMRPHTLDWVVATSHVGDDRVVIVGVEPSAVADLSAGFGVEWSLVENDFTGVAGIKLSNPLAPADYVQDYAVVGARMTIAFEFRFRELLVSRICRLLGRNSRNLNSKAIVIRAPT